jgi:hypothetical protein
VAGDGERRRSAASGGALAGETRYRVPGHDLAHGSHLCTAGDAANLSRAARLAEARRRRRTKQRRGAAAKLQRASTDDTARGDNNKRLGWPPHLLACLRGSSSMVKRRRRWEATAAEALGFWWQLGCGQRRRLGFGGRPQGGAARLIRPEGRLGVRAKHGKA